METQLRFLPRSFHTFISSPASPMYLWLQKWISLGHMKELYLWRPSGGWTKTLCFYHSSFFTCQNGHSKERFRLHHSVDEPLWCGLLICRFHCRSSRTMLHICSQLALSTRNLQFQNQILQIFWVEWQCVLDVTVICLKQEVRFWCYWQDFVSVKNFDSDESSILDSVSSL